MTAVIGITVSEACPESQDMPELQQSEESGEDSGDEAPSAPEGQGLVVVTNAIDDALFTSASGEHAPFWVTLMLWQDRSPPPQILVSPSVPVVCVTMSLHMLSINLYHAILS